MGQRQTDQASSPLSIWWETPLGERSQPILSRGWVVLAPCPGGAPQRLLRVVALAGLCEKRREAPSCLAAMEAGAAQTRVADWRQIPDPTQINPDRT